MQMTTAVPAQGVWFVSVSPKLALFIFKKPSVRMINLLVLMTGGISGRGSREIYNIIWENKRKRKG